MSHCETVVDGHQYRSHFCSNFELVPIWTINWLKTTMHSRHYAYTQYIRRNGYCTKSDSSKTNNAMVATPSWQSREKRNLYKSCILSTEFDSPPNLVRDKGIYSTRAGSMLTSAGPAWDLRVQPYGTRRGGSTDAGVGTDGSKKWRIEYCLSRRSLMKRRCSSIAITRSTW